MDTPIFDLAAGRPESLSVLIVGGGIGGLAAAIALRQNGHRVSVLDQTGLDTDSGAAIHLCPNASGILHQWNIHAEAFGACLMSRYIERATDGKTLKNIDLTESNARWPHPWHLVHRASLHKELKRVATSQERPGPPVKLFPRHRVVHIDQQRKVTLDNGKVVEADVIIGADGIFSTTRQRVKPALPFPTGKAAFRFVIPRSLAEIDPITAPLVSQKDTLTIWFADDRRVVMYPCDNNEWLNFVCIHPDIESQELKSYPPLFMSVSPDIEPPTDSADSENPSTRIKWSPEWNKNASLNQVLRIFKDFDPSLKALFTKADSASIKVWQLMDMETLYTWVSGKLALLGDAAHPCLPYQAQGGAQAIEDAAALAAVLPLGTGPEEVNKRLKLYELIRCGRAHRIQEYSRMTGQDWVGGKPVVDMRAFEKYNFDHDEIAHATGIFKKWEASERSEDWTFLRAGS